ncbi:MAG TPA: DUF1015 family protein, partial [Thermoanaerobaculia bacterium]
TPPMARVRPFPSGRPPRALAGDNRQSFLHVCRPEIDLPEDTDIHAPAVYAKGRENLDRFYADGTLVGDPVPRLLVYRQTWKGRKQDGLVAACSVDDYDADVIRKHEKTRRDKEDDRVAHLLAQSAHAEPVFLTYRAVDAIDARVASVTAGTPEFDFEAPDAVRHTLWLVPETDVAFFTSAFAAVPLLYVADGHHRCASASRARAALKEKLGSLPDEHPVNWFPATIFPDRELAILPYNRVVKDLGGLGTGDFLEGVRKKFSIVPAIDASPSRKGQFSMFFEETWQALTPKEPVTSSDPVASLDVSILQDRLLGPVLGIGDPRTDPRIDFVGGIRGTGELEERVKSGRGAVAFAMYPTQISDVMAIADAGVTMPPKSTWFEPKLRSGLFVHRF